MAYTKLGDDKREETRRMLNSPAWKIFAQYLCREGELHRRYLLGGNLNEKDNTIAVAKFHILRLILEDVYVGADYNLPDYIESTFR